MPELSNRVALITGAARGIGADVARALARQGATVIVSDVLIEIGETLVARLRAEGLAAEFLALDVTSAQAWQSAVASIQANHGRLDILINNAGIMAVGGVEDTSVDLYRKVMSISADGTFLGMKYCQSLLQQRPDDSPYGNVVNISSIAALQGSSAALAYAASRSATLSMTKSAAVDWAQRGYKIRVNALLPGSVATELSNVAYDALKSKGMTQDQAVAFMTKLHPIGRLGTVEDISEAVLYFVSDRASFLTGSSLVIDGGRTAG